MIDRINNKPITLINCTEKFRDKGSERNFETAAIKHNAGKECKIPAEQDMNGYDEFDSKFCTELNRKNNSPKQGQSFKGLGGGALTLLRGLNNSPALGACAVDLCSMVTPRTAIEFKNRGKQAGIEAAFREGASCVIHACVGLIGLGAAILLSGKFNKSYGVKAQNIFASANTINNMASVWEKSNGHAEQFFEGFMNNLKGLNGSEWKSVSETANKELVKDFINLAQKTTEADGLKGLKRYKALKEVKNIKNIIVSKITQDTGAQASYKLIGNDKVKTVSAGLGELIDNAVAVSNSFKTKTKEKLPEFVNALMKNKTASTVLGLAVCAALCMSVQPLNRYLTKKRTGQDGFVGVENKKADDTKGFKTAKTIAGIAFPAFAISTIGNLRNLLSNVQFNSKIPTINQFKFLYGLTIGSRFLAARDKNELRESIIKDTLGFTNWLILGGMVSKLTARAIGGKELINNPIADEGAKKGLKYAFNWVSKASVKSFDEVLLPQAKNIIKDGKVKKFTDILKTADKAAKTKVFKIAGSQVMGYLYSGLVLGIGIAKLNIFITKKLEAKKQKEQEQENKTVNYNFMNQELSSVFKDFE